MSLRFREILLRRTPLRPGGWLFVLVSSVCLAFSACFEFIEWWSALALGAAADAFLATQGDVWDIQWDVFLCLIGAILAQVLLSRTHDRQLATIQPSTGGEARELDATDVPLTGDVGSVEFTTEGRALVEQVVEVSVPGAGDEGGHLVLVDDEGAGLRRRCSVDSSMTARISSCDSRGWPRLGHTRRSR